MVDFVEEIWMMKNTSGTSKYVIIQGWRKFNSKTCMYSNTLLGASLCIFSMVALA